MNKAMPRIQESSETLKAQMGETPHPLQRQRLHALYLVASGQATTRHAVARLLGLSRNTIGQWFTTYEGAGLQALLQVGTPPGKQPTLTGPQLAQLREALARPAGFASYKAVQRWIATTFDVDLAYSATHKLVRYKLGAKLKVPRRSHIKKP